jgi:glycosyltransferase involved in cell wall biosynthesis
MATGCTVLMVDGADRQGYAGAVLAEQDIAGVARALREVWPRRAVLIDRSPYATDARRLRALPLDDYDRVVVVRPGACLLPAAALRAAFVQAAQRPLDVTRLAGIPHEVCYIASARAIALVAAVGGVPGCVTVPQAVERLAAAGASFEGRRLTVGSVPVMASADTPSLVAALSPHAWTHPRLGTLLSMPSDARLPEALRLQHHAFGNARAELQRLDRTGRRRPPGVHKEVLVVVPSMFQSGAHAAWSALADHLSPAQVAFVVGHSTVLRRVLDAKGFTVAPVHEGLAAGSAVDAASFMTALHEIRPSVVHFDGAEGSAWAGTVYGRGLRVIQHIRLNDVERFSAAFTFADAVIGVSPQVCRDAAARVGTAVRVEHIPDGVCLTPRVTPAAGIASILCVCIGRVEPAKGQLRVLDIFRSLRDRIACRLVIVGPCGRDAAYCDEVRDRIATEYPAGEATWEPFRTPIDDLYAQAHVVLVGSRNEALGMVGLEALAAGALLVAHRSAGYECIVDPAKKEGLLFDAQEPEADVASRIVEALQDHEAYAVSGRRKVATDFDARDTAARLARLWTEVAAAR